MGQDGDVENDVFKMLMGYCKTHVVLLINSCSVCFFRLFPHNEIKLEIQ